jgi:hypothetical protein
MTPIIVLFISMTFIMPPEIYCHWKNLVEFNHIHM